LGLVGAKSSRKTWILSRILWLEGLEARREQAAPGIDSFERYIYIHGTNQEDLLGVPRRTDACACLQRTRPWRLGDLLQAKGRRIHRTAGRPVMRWHFAGIGGTGMSAIAFYLLGRGQDVSGSDRLFDRGGGAAIRAALESRGARIHPQDGSGIAPDVRLVVSTAVEADVPEVRAARELGCEIVHRSEALASIANAARTIAVSGTSGKSTVTAMVFRVLREAGLDPSVISGGVLKELAAEGHWGNAYGGAGEWLVIEADESDGSLVQYAPEIGLMLNLDRDHKELDELRTLFATFRDRSKIFAANGDRGECRELGGSRARYFGLEHHDHPRSKTWSWARTGSPSASVETSAACLFPANTWSRTPWPPCFADSRPACLWRSPRAPWPRSRAWGVGTISWARPAA
jgi:hypothetical protein